MKTSIIKEVAKTITSETFDSNVKTSVKDNCTLSGGVTIQFDYVNTGIACSTMLAMTQKEYNRSDWKEALQRKLERTVLLINDEI